jgi:hypothetical protein
MNTNKKKIPKFDIKTWDVTMPYGKIKLCINFFFILNFGCSQRWRACNSYYLTQLCRLNIQYIALFVIGLAYASYHWQMLWVVLENKFLVDSARHIYCPFCYRTHLCKLSLINYMSSLGIFWVDARHVTDSIYQV